MLNRVAFAASGGCVIQTILHNSTVLVKFEALNQAYICFVLIQNRHVGDYR